MKLNGRRESTNVDDRRGKRGGKMALGGAGIVGVIVAALMAIMSGQDPGTVVGDALQQAQNQPTTETVDPSSFSPEEQELATFSKQILAGTEDVWSELFRQMGRTYEPPRLVLYTGSTMSACGQGQSQMGPFYCSGDQAVYIDLSFFMNMRQELGADGDFAYAYVIAHEVGHHVQYLLGTLDDAHSQMARLSEKESNKIQVRLELQADFYAGVWAHHDNKRFGSLEPGDVDEALDCAQKIGDNYLQEKARGYSVPESFTHGTSQQRRSWLNKGVRTGDIRQGDTFSLPYNQL